MLSSSSSQDRRRRRKKPTEDPQPTPRARPVGAIVVTRRLLPQRSGRRWLQLPEGANRRSSSTPTGTSDRNRPFVGNDRSAMRSFGGPFTRRRVLDRITAVVRFRRLSSCSAQNPPCRFDVRLAATRGDELGRLHGGDLLRDRGGHELIDAGAVFFADLGDGRLQRRWKTQRIRAGLSLHSAILRNACWGDSTAIPNRPGTSPKSRPVEGYQGIGVPVDGRHRNAVHTGSATAHSAETTSRTSSSPRPETTRWSGSRQALIFQHEPYGSRPTAQLPRAVGRQ